MEENQRAGFVRVAHDIDEAFLSVEALTLHTYAVLAGIRDQRPGMITDRYLNSIGDEIETTTPAFELVLAGLWTRVADGYVVEEAEVVRIARIVRAQLDDGLGLARG